MDVTIHKAVLSFVGHEEGETVLYKIRTKGEQLAQELKKAVDHEIEYVTAHA